MKVKAQPCCSGKRGRLRKPQSQQLPGRVAGATQASEGTLATAILGGPPLPEASSPPAAHPQAGALPGDHRGLPLARVGGPRVPPRPRGGRRDAAESAGRAGPSTARRPLLRKKLLPSRERRGESLGGEPWPSRPSAERPWLLSSLFLGEGGIPFGGAVPCRE